MSALDLEILQLTKTTKGLDGREYATLLLLVTAPDSDMVQTGLQFAKDNGFFDKIMDAAEFVVETFHKLQQEG